MLRFLLKEYAQKLNTLTKYPSILTFHNLGVKKGTLIDTLTSDKFPKSDDEELEGTEKVDGTNSRIIICGEDYAIGMREDIIYIKGDKTINDKLGVLSNCIPIAERLVKENSFDKNTLIVIYGEHYGFNVGANYKNYAKGKNIEFRVFDTWDMSISEILELFEKYDLNRLSTWRKQENQPFYPIDKLNSFVTTLGLKRTPVLFKIKKGDLKMSIEDMYKFLLTYKDTIVGLDNNGKSEGFVVRSKDRKYIKKIRLEEYEKTLRLRDLEVEKLKKMLSK